MKLHTDRPPGAILHYSMPPVAGGVEEVIRAHVRHLTRAGYPVTMIAGRGDERAMENGAKGVVLPTLDTLSEEILAINAELEKGEVPPSFDSLVEKIATQLRPLLEPMQWVIIHNVLTKHFNLAFSAALWRLIDQRVIRRPIAWCHDISWTSAHSRPKLSPGYPWDLLRTYNPAITYVAISKERQRELSGLLGISENEIRVVYNGVDPATLLGLTSQGMALCEKLDLFSRDLILLMPVRITQAKDIEFALSLTAALKALQCRVKLIVTGPPDPHDESNVRYYRSLLNQRRELGIIDEASFIYESGPDPKQAYLIDENMIGQLYRLADIVLLPSRREGFGIPVLEAGLAGVPLAATDVPAAQEIGQNDFFLIKEGHTPESLAEELLNWSQEDRTQRLCRRVRKGFTWEQIFELNIQPLLEEGLAVDQ
jgi:glycosyltransferase involved in cell wall biosynthesis